MSIDTKDQMFISGGLLQKFSKTICVIPTTSLTRILTLRFSGASAQQLDEHAAFFDEVEQEIQRYEYTFHTGNAALDSVFSGASAITA